MLIRELLQGEPKANMHTRTEIPWHYKFIKKNKQKIQSKRDNPKMLLVFSLLYSYCLTIDGIPKLTNWSWNENRIVLFNLTLNLFGRWRQKGSSKHYYRESSFAFFIFLLTSLQPSSTLVHSTGCSQALPELGEVRTKANLIQIIFRIH